MGKIYTKLKVYQSRLDFWRGEQGSKRYGLSDVAERFIAYYEEQLAVLKRRQVNSVRNNDASLVVPLGSDQTTSHNA